MSGAVEDAVPPTPTSRGSSRGKPSGAKPPDAAGAASSPPKPPGVALAGAVAASRCARRPHTSGCAYRRGGAGADARGEAAALPRRAPRPRPPTAARSRTYGRAARMTTTLPTTARPQTPRARSRASSARAASGPRDGEATDGGAREARRRPHRADSAEPRRPEPAVGPRAVRFRGAWRVARG